MKKYQKIWQYILIAGFIILAIFILDKYLALRGVLELSYDFSDEPTLISEITPKGRATDRLKNLTTKETYQSLSGDPVYFGVDVPRSFDNAEVSLTYRNPAQKIIELGLRKSIDWNFELKPLENKFVDQSEWEKLENEQFQFFQKEKNFESIDAFLANPPKDKKIALYNYALKYNFTIDDYQASDQTLEINNALRGKHEFFTYIKDENLDFNFQFQDINWGYGPDDFVVKVYHQDTEIYNDFIVDDGNIEVNGVASELKEKKVELTNLGEGLYKIVIDVSDDIVVRKIQTQQHLLVVKDDLFLVDNQAYQDSISDLVFAATELYSNSDKFLFKTDHPTGLQTVMINKDTVEINEMSKYADWQNLNSTLATIKMLNIPKNDLALKGYGYFAFTENSFFDPDYGVEFLRADTEIDSFYYLLAADYIAPTEINKRWQVAQQNFDLNNVPGDRKHLDFLLSLPGLDQLNNDVVVSEIKIKLTRKPFLTRLYEKFK